MPLNENIEKLLGNYVYLDTLVRNSFEKDPTSKNFEARRAIISPSGRTMYEENPDLAGEQLSVNILQNLELLSGDINKETYPGLRNEYLKDFPLDAKKVAYETIIRDVVLPKGEVKEELKEVAKEISVIKAVDELIETKNYNGLKEIINTYSGGRINYDKLVKLWLDVDKPTEVEAMGRKIQHIAKIGLMASLDEKVMKAVDGIIDSTKDTHDYARALGRIYATKLALKHRRK